MEEDTKEVVDAEITENAAAVENNEAIEQKPNASSYFAGMSESFKNKFRNDRAHHEKVMAKRRIADKRAKKARKITRARSK